MKVTLWQLNEGFQALQRLASKELPKEHFKLTYKLGRIYKAAKSEMESWGDAVARLMAANGFKQLPTGALVQVDDSETPATPDQIDAFNKASKKVMQEEICHLGDHYTAFDANELLKVVTISAQDFGNLYDWLITGEIPDDLPEEKAAAATA